MPFSRAHLIIIVLLAPSVATANAKTSDCRHMASLTDKPTNPSPALARIRMAKEPHVAMSAVEEDARATILACPDLERAWYELARAWEMIGSPEMVNRGEFLRILTIAPFTLAPSTFTSFASLSKEAFRRFPHSPRIALLSLRGSPSVSQAKALVEQFPDFPPMKLVLAQAHLSAGDWTQALSILRENKAVSALPAAPALLAQSLLAKGDFKASLSALSKQTDPISADSAGYEAYSCRYECAALRFKALLATHRPPEALRELAVIVEEFPPMTRVVLASVSATDLGSLEKAIGKARLTAGQRNTLKKALSEFAASPGANR